MTDRNILTDIEPVVKTKYWLREDDEPIYEYTFLMNGSIFKEDIFKQKLILTLKSLKQLSVATAIPEAAAIITQGLKEGAEVRGYSVFEIGNTTLTVKAKKVTGAKAQELAAEQKLS
jgi:hypothetical protein